MLEITEITEAIFRAIDQVNLQLAKEKLEKSEDAILTGKSGKLDSLGLINFIVAVEEELEEASGMSISLTTQTPGFRKNHPFTSVRTLAEYINVHFHELAN